MQVPGKVYRLVSNGDKIVISPELVAFCAFNVPQGTITLIDTNNIYSKKPRR